MIFMAAFAATFGMAFTACSNEDTGNAAQQSEIAKSAQKAIGFTTNVDNIVPTRATAATTATVQADGFHVWAYNGTASVINNAEVTYASSAWSYSPLQYWPTNGDLLKFQAVTPYDWADDNSATIASTSASTIITDLVIPAANASQKDLMFARQGTAAGINYSGTEDKVALEFQHALSQIVFQAKLKDTPALKSATVSELSICKVNSKGTITFVQDLGSSTTQGITSTPASTAVNANYTAGLTGSAVTNKSAYTNITATDGALMLLPQAITAATVAEGNKTEPSTGTYLKIKVQVLDQNDNVLIPNTDTYYLAINDVTWLPGRKYTYNIEFTESMLTPIVFGSVTVGSWTDVTGSPNPVEF